MGAGAIMGAKRMLRTPFWRQGFWTQSVAASSRRLAVPRLPCNRDVFRISVRVLCHPCCFHETAAVRRAPAVPRACNDSPSRSVRSIGSVPWASKQTSGAASTQ
eukprot:8318904-Alexandrium_andersonii.AAC.1